jgi:hypothetical protein
MNEYHRIPLGFEVYFCLQPKDEYRCVNISVITSKYFHRYNQHLFFEAVNEDVFIVKVADYEPNYCGIKIIEAACIAHGSLSKIHSLKLDKLNSSVLKNGYRLLDKHRFYFSFSLRNLYEGLMKTAFGFYQVHIQAAQRHTVNFERLFHSQTLPDQQLPEKEFKEELDRTMSQFFEHLNLLTGDEQNISILKEISY